MVTDEEFQQLINDALASLPQERMAHVQNVAFLFEDFPTPEQRLKLSLRHDQTLLGLYEGTPLSQRQGMVMTFPDRITLFKVPLCAMANSRDDLQKQIRHTIWHELAHYFGLDHPAIRELENT